jgi:hypothetical protein
MRGGGAGRVRPGALTLALLAAGGCARPELAASPERDRLGARRALAAAAAAGPVPLVVAGAPPGSLDPSGLPALAARGAAGLDPRFATTPASAASDTDRLVLWFDPPPGAAAADACRPAPPPGPAATGGAPSLLAAWCEDAYAAASVAGAAAGAGPEDVERLVWRATQRLFPDDYGETYGLDLFGWRVRLGGSASF